MGQHINRMLQHILPRGDQLGDDGTGHGVVSHLKRRFDHRQDESLDAKTIVPDVAPLGLQQPRHQRIAIGVRRQQLCEPLLCQLEETLVVPQRIIRIEGNSC